MDLTLILTVAFDIIQLLLELLKVLSPYIVIGISWLAVQASGVVNKLPGILVVVISALVGALLQLINTWLVNPDLNPIYAVGLGFAAIFISQFLKQIQSGKILEDRKKIAEDKAKAIDKVG